MNFIWWLLGFLLGVSIVWLVKLIFFRPFSINHFFERIMLQFALGVPEILTMLRIFERVGIHSHNKKLNDESDAFKKKQNARLRRNLAILKSYDRNKLNLREQLSYDIMEWFLQDFVDGQAYDYHDYPINQLFGIQNQLPTFMATLHQIRNKRDARHYIIRLSKFGQKFAQVIEGLKIRASRGVLPPLFVFNKVLQEMQSFVSVPAEENILYVNMAEKLTKITALSAAEQDALLKCTKVEIEQTVYPAYQALSAYFAELKEQATTDDGVWKLPQGGEYYQYQLRHYTTTKLTAAEIHDIGLSEVSRIQSEMADVLAGLGHTGKPPIALMDDLSQDPRFTYPDDNEARLQALRDYQAMIDRIEQSIGHLFDIRPKGKVVVDRIPEFKEKTAPGAYYNPSAMDGSRPGVFSVNLQKMSVKFHMETLAFHEAVPGHHFQLAIQQELKGLPTFRKVIPFTAYAEGWALYAEKLIYEHDLFSDGYSRLGYLASELFRAVRLVVDTGLHYKQWTREQAIEYMSANTGTSRNSVIIEVERYIVMPGQATAYKIGELEILRLRDKAKTALADSFDIREFHNVILKNGSVPLVILARLVDEYIAARG